MIGLIVLCVFVGSSMVQGKILTPCGLANDLYHHLTAKYGIHEFMNYNQETIGLMVCIAAYHDFNTSNLVLTDDGNRREGIFGLVAHVNETDKFNFTDDCIKDDTEYFIEKVLYVPQDNKNLVKNSFVRDFYEDLCDKFMASHEVYCHLSEYVFGNFPVWIPNDKSLLYGKCYQTPGGNGKPRRCTSLAGDILIDNDPFFPPIQTFGVNTTNTTITTGIY
uniref:Tyrosinase n=1 Tax=Lygus hesperus TaxID=30085 RepID=A0A0A9YUZ3_LYGHE